jgi:hypothetical protein
MPQRRGAICANGTQSPVAQTAASMAQSSRGLRNRVVREWVRRVAVLMAAGLLAACAAGAQSAPEVRPGPSPWKVGQFNDSIRGKTPAAIINFTFAVDPFNAKFEQGLLVLECFRNNPVVRFAFPYKVGSNQSASLAYRFDENQGVDPKVRFLRDYSTIVIEDVSEVRRFLTELATATKLNVRIDSHIAKRTNLYLDVQGAGPAIDTVLAGCPLPPMSEPKRA